MNNIDKRPLKGKSTLEMPSDYVVIDIETTGLSPCGDEIIELAALKVVGDMPVSEFQSLVKPKFSISSYISMLTGITNKMVADKQSIEEVLPAFMDFISDSHYIGHNVHFDINFIYDNAEKYCMPLPSNNITDTVRLAHRAFPELPNHSLDTVAERCKVSAQGHHRALADCYITHGCYQYIKTYINKNCCEIAEHKPKVPAKDIIPAPTLQLKSNDGFSTDEKNTKQINLFDDSEHLSEEKNALSKVEPAFRAIAEGWYLPESALSAETLESSGKLSVKLFDSVICRFKLSGKTKYIEIPTECACYVSPDVLYSSIKSDKAYIRLPVVSFDDVDKYADTLRYVLIGMIVAIPKEFSCCSRYEQCSDCGKCIHPDRDFAKGCYYKKVLHSGKVFYGINKTN